MPLSDDDEAVRCINFSLRREGLTSPAFSEINASKGLVILINQGLLADHEAKGCPKAIVQEQRLHHYFWRRKGKLIFLEIEFPPEFIEN
ncbi:hypothetical protein D6C34_17690 [Escherichia coli]|nr:hypothetical protein [Escherichia coli]